ncbi:MAG: T9SS type A sorting domain-containing protein [Bacteroidales bacterium]|jgi:hypothetical protein|nr:T9SS type A sorting domain-containing protein [Bacteroidales bacterium]
MKNLVLSITFIFALGVNLFGQIHKDEKNRPMSSTHYVFQNNDSIQDNETFYTYNSNKQLIEKIIYSRLSNSVDSTSITYNADNRIVSSNQFINGTLSSSETWVYDVPNKQIDYSYSIEILDSLLLHTIYMGVNDFDELSTSSIAGSLLDEVLGTSMIDCDSIDFMTYDATSSSWTTMKMYPKYQNGKPVSAKVMMNDLDLSMLELILSMFGIDLSSLGLQDTKANLLLDYKFVYNGDNLTNINITPTITLQSFPLPIPLTNAITLTNQYNGNNLLIESTVVIDVSYSGFPQSIYRRMRQRYDYRRDSNISVMTEENSSDRTSWDVTGKTYYFYDKEDIKDTTSHNTTIYNNNLTLNNVTFSMSQNIPNPADNQTLITYSVPTDGQATFLVYSMIGQLVSSQSLEVKAGENTLKLATNNLAPGLYLYALDFKGRRLVKKMTVR